MAYCAFVGLVAGLETHVLCVLGFYIIGLSFLPLHVAAHHLEKTELHRVHIQHHEDHFPQSDFYRSLYPDFQRDRSAGVGKPQTMLSMMNLVRQAAGSTWSLHAIHLMYLDNFALVLVASGGHESMDSEEIKLRF